MEIRFTWVANYLLLDSYTLTLTVNDGRGLPNSINQNTFDISVDWSDIHTIYWNNGEGVDNFINFENKDPITLYFIFEDTTNNENLTGFISDYREDLISVSIKPPSASIILAMDRLTQSGVTYIYTFYPEETGPHPVFINIGYGQSLVRTDTFDVNCDNTWRYPGWIEYCAIIHANTRWAIRQAYHHGHTDLQPGIRFNNNDLVGFLDCTCHFQKGYPTYNNREEFGGDDIDP